MVTRCISAATDFGRGQSLGQIKLKNGDDRNKFCFFSRIEKSYVLDKKQRHIHEHQLQ